METEEVMVKVRIDLSPQGACFLAHFGRQTIIMTLRTHNAIVLTTASYPDASHKTKFVQLSLLNNNVIYMY